MNNYLKSVNTVCLLVFLCCQSICGQYLGRQYDTGYIEKCPGAEQPVSVTDEFLSTKLYFVVQVHFPHYTHRKRYYYLNAIEEIGNDPDLDFRNRKTFMFMVGYIDSSNLYTTTRYALGNYAAKGYITMAIETQQLYSFVYPVASRVSRQIGNLTATVLHGLAKYGLRAQDIEIAGMSIGGQTVSFVGKHYTRLSGKKISKITSMDPSGPCFRNEGPDERLSPGDADFVQVIHTNSDAFGMARPSGHVDFYMNGGEWQHFIDPYIPWFDEFFSHTISFLYYFTAFILHPDKFVGVKCKSVQQAREHKCYDNLPHKTNVMGPKADPSKPGIYYVPVEPNAPFYAPVDFLEKRLNNHLLYNDAFSDIENYVFSEDRKHEKPKLKSLFH